MTNKSELGAAGELHAAKHLKKAGYKVFDMNYRQPWGEIDILAIAPDKTLVFVEVKTVSGDAPRITAEDQLTSAKLKKLQRTCELYANGNEKLSANGWRIDLLALNLVNGEWRIRHYENI